MDRSLRVYHRSGKLVLALGGILKQLQGKIAFGVLAISMSIFTSGCNQSSDTTDPTSANGSAANPNMDNPAPGEKMKYTDISAQEANTAKPLKLLGGKPLAQVDPEMLSALKRSYIEHGTPLMASRLELSYDFNTGKFKGDPSLLTQKSTGLGKAASTSAWDGNFTYQGYFYGLGWSQVKAHNNEWIGDPNYFLNGWSINTSVIDGVTPSIYWNLRWTNYGDGRGWTSTYSWNDVGDSETHMWFGFQANTKTAGYDVCWEMRFTAHNQGAALSGCDGGSVSASQDVLGLHQFKFTILTQ